MKNRALLLTLFIGMFLFLFAGCYTQVGATHDDYYHGTYNSGVQDDSTYSNNDNNGYNGDEDENWHHHSDVGFSYYYPPYASYPSAYFNAAYSDPYWGFGIGFGYGYGYGYGGGYPYYGYGGGYYPYYPYYGYGYPCYGYGYPYYYYQNQTIRTYGSTRSGSTGSGGRPVSTGRGYGAPTGDIQAGSVGTIPTGAGFRSGGASQPAGRSANVNSVPRNGGNSRVNGKAPAQGSVNPNSRSRDARATGSRGSMTHGSSPRDAQHINPPAEYRSHSTPPSGQGSRQSVGKYFTPQQQSGSRNSAAPHYSAPPPSSGGRSAPSAPAARGGGGGGSRGGRP